MNAKNDNNDDIIFLDPDTDGYSNGDTGSMINGPFMRAQTILQIRTIRNGWIIRCKVYKYSVVQRIASTSDKIHDFKILKRSMLNAFFIFTA